MWENNLHKSGAIVTEEDREKEEKEREEQERAEREKRRKQEKEKLENERREREKKEAQEREIQARKTQSQPVIASGLVAVVEMCLGLFGNVFLVQLSFLSHVRVICATLNLQDA